MKAHESPKAAQQRGPTVAGRSELLLHPLFLTALVLLIGLVSSQGALTVRDALKKPAAWFVSPEGSHFISNVLSHQSSVGSWPKNENTGATAYTDDPAKLKGTFDNGATTGELRLLAKAFHATANPVFSNAVVRGIDHILGAQYTNGGWPQYSPPPTKSYHRHITFNDDAMRKLLELLREVATTQEVGRRLPPSRLDAGSGLTGESWEAQVVRTASDVAAGAASTIYRAGAARREPSPYQPSSSIAANDLFAFIDPARRANAAAAFAKGIECIVKCQVRVDGKLTSWCAQHDAVTLEPRPARAYELASLSGNESAGLLHLLMSLDKPPPGVVQAVHAGAAWFDSVKLTGIREVKVDGNKTIVRDAAAPPLWARFYELGTNRPFYCSRDGVKRFDIAEIDAERRNGYAWHGNWGAEMANRYAEWKTHWPAPAPKP